jgi:arginyl-tRNA synthetase
MEFPQVRPEVDTELPPNRFCDQVPVLKADQPARSSSLALCRLTADTLRLGLGLQGIPAQERM